MTLASVTQVENARFFEYFWQDERHKNAPHCSPGLAGLSQGGDFTLHGHRLSSLYRTIHSSRAWLMNSDLVTSSCQKYSNSNGAIGAPVERICA